MGILMALYLLWKSNEPRKSLPFFLGGLFFGYASVATGLVVAGNIAYGTDRSFIFLTIPFAIMTSVVLASKVERGKLGELCSKALRLVVLLFVLISIVILPVTRYASDPYEFISESEHAARIFHEQHFASARTGVKLFEIYYNHAYLKQLRSREEYFKECVPDFSNRVYDNGSNSLFIQRRN